MRDRLGSLKQKNPAATLRVRWVPYEQILKILSGLLSLPRMVSFWNMKDLISRLCKRPTRKTCKRPVVAGGSTISQQLAKNLFLSDEKTPWRKIEEAIITLMLENVMSKRSILEIYLNVIEWGNGVFGAEAATRYYYGVSASSLSAEQSARLAAMIPNPRYYDLNRNTPWLLKKTSIILGRMPSANVP